MHGVGCFVLCTATDKLQYFIINIMFVVFSFAFITKIKRGKKRVR